MREALLRDDSGPVFASTFFRVRMRPSHDQSSFLILGIHVLPSLSVASWIGYLHKRISNKNAVACPARITRTLFTCRQIITETVCMYLSRSFVLRFIGFAPFSRGLGFAFLFFLRRVSPCRFPILPLVSLVSRQIPPHAPYIVSHHYIPWTFSFSRF